MSATGTLFSDILEQPPRVTNDRQGIVATRTFILTKLAGTGAIRSVSIREPGQVRGTRLFNLASILAFIEKCEHGAAEEVAAETTEPANSASNVPAKRGDTSFPLHVSRKRRRAETIAPSCPL